MIPAEFKILYLAIIAIALMLGLISKKKVGKIIAGMVFFPIVILFLWTMIQSALMQFQPQEQVLILFFGFFILLFFVLLGTSFGREVIASFLGGLLLEIFKTTIRFFGRLRKITMGIFKK